jgi:DNA (cytosine-5)-methyltransferase 1
VTAYYNEIDPFAAEWLRNLIWAGLIAPGDVDTRSIEDVKPDDLRGYTQCHFFAGIGVWSHALRRAGWPDDRPVWTGSCPCQPFSAAGKRGGFTDERHLWPAWHWLIAECCPDVVFGEQVASALDWFDLVSSDLEATGYAVGASDTCAAGVGAPHIRQRLYYVAERLADGDDTRLEGRLGTELRERPDQCAPGSGGSSRGLADTERDGRHGGRSLGASGGCKSTDGNERDQSHGPLPTDGFWQNADWLFCRDGKWRPVESGTFPLVDGAASRVGRLRAFGNCIVAPQAEAFIRAARDVIE